MILWSWKMMVFNAREWGLLMVDSAYPLPLPPNINGVSPNELCIDSHLWITVSVGWVVFGGGGSMTWKLCWLLISPYRKPEYSHNGHITNHRYTVWYVKVLKNTYERLLSGLDFNNLTYAGASQKILSNIYRYIIYYDCTAYMLVLIHSRLTNCIAVAGWWNLVVLYLCVVQFHVGGMEVSCPKTLSSSWLLMDDKWSRLMSEDQLVLAT